MQKNSTMASVSALNLHLTRHCHVFKDQLGEGQKGAERAGGGRKGMTGRKGWSPLEGRRKGWSECVSKKNYLKAPLVEHCTSPVNSV